MKPKTMILMAVAITCGLGASYMTSRLLAERTTQETEDKVKVLVLKRNMNQGMALKNIEDIFEEKDFVAGQQPREAINEPSQLRGKVLKRSLRAGDFIRPEDVLGDKEYTLANLMPEGYRAIGIRVTNESIAGGFAALPHSRVDIVCNVRNDKSSYSQLLLENVLVLAADAQIHRNENGQAMPANVVTVALKPEDTLKVDLARSMGPLSLVLRRFNDNSTAGDIRMTADGLLNRSSSSDLTEQAGLDTSAPPIVPAQPKVEPLNKEIAKSVQEPVQVAEAKKKGKVFRMRLLEGPNERFVDFMQQEDGTFTHEEVGRSEPTPSRSAAKGDKDESK